MSPYLTRPMDNAHLSIGEPKEKEGKKETKHNGSTRDAFSLQLIRIVIIILHILQRQTSGLHGWRCRVRGLHMIMNRNPKLGFLFRNTIQNKCFHPI